MKLSLTRTLARIAVASMPFAAAAAAEPSAHVDHIILGVADLEHGIDQFERLTGVRPAYGGKHPAGTHNALVSLGDHTFVEILAVQPDALPTPQFPQLPSLKDLTPVGWALTSENFPRLQEEIATTGLQVTGPKPGSRAVPQGTTLHWVMFDLQRRVEAAPFFITWGTSAHPSATAPTGCTLVSWSVAGPEANTMNSLRRLTGPPVVVAVAAFTTMSLVLTCPKGIVKFDFSGERP